MLRNVHIRSFKGLRDVRLDECGAINALIGKNNSGKSSILHAIDMAGLALSVRNWEPFRAQAAPGGPVLRRFRHRVGLRGRLRAHHPKARRWKPACSGSL